MMRHNSLQKILVLFIAFVLAITVTIFGWNEAIVAKLPAPGLRRVEANIAKLPAPPPRAEANIIKLPTPPLLAQADVANQSAAPLRAVEGPAEKMGAWYTPPMPKDINERVQGLNAALLPNGKVLIANGGSVRLFLANEGVEGKDGRPPWLLDNTSVFDPTLSDPFPLLDAQGNSIKAIDYSANPFTKITSPPSPVRYKGSASDEVNDPFCGGHLHLPNGDVLFVSGSWFPYPAPTPLGTKQANRYNWKENKWELAGEMSDGHWYPTLLPLESGKIAVFSGISYDELKVTSQLDVFDPNQPPENAWQSLDLKNLPNTPYNTPKEDGEPDFIDLYAHTYPTKDGRFLITGDSGGTREIPARKTHNTYFMSIKDSKDGLSVEFQPGPKREGWSKYYTTSLLDPNSPNGDILLMGGLEGMNNPNFGPDLPVEGARTTASIERWRAPVSGGIGEWELKENFLGDSPSARRTTPNAVILPNKQILVVNGGNYVFYMPVYHPILMTPEQNAPLGYKTKWMNPGTEPRLYHNNAILLPDARVLVLGGQGGYAAWDNRNGPINPPVDQATQLRLDIKAGTGDLIDKGQNFFLAETWQPEIFNPPYLFIKGPRSEITQAPEQITYGSQQTISVSNPTNNASLVLIKLGSVTHSFNVGQRLVDLQFQQNIANDASAKLASISFTAPTDKHMSPPGYYMMFYINDKGKPSHAKMVQLVL
ncbi:MAG: DUF1929 domain-containing protein [Iphinoe sp. HA4291-MV1]|jgi:hypothetical protein|nr:DUF1929 domain-containing protein [Iphinoe sp. HA4291-MV1]